MGVWVISKEDMGKHTNALFLVPQNQNMTVWWHVMPISPLVIDDKLKINVR